MNVVQMLGLPNSWKGTRGYDQARQLIDYGVMLKWRDMRTMRREIPAEDEEKIVRHFATRLVERCSVRLQAEILVESAMIWLANAASEKLLHVFLEELFAQPGCDEACWQIVEIALTSELAEHSHEGDIFEMAVALICELGISVQEYDKAYPGEFQRAQALLDHIATYLLSVSNTNSSCIRLSLLHYFGVTEHALTNKACFNRIMSRFGHTVLDHLFALLFRKRSEAVALQFLLENLPYVLEADRHSQKIVHETFKYYMLKQPERFCLFIQAFSDEILEKNDQSYGEGVKTFLQHLGAMLKVASDVNHKQLGQEFLLAILKFDRLPFCKELLAHLHTDADIKKPFRELLEQLRASHQGSDVVDASLQFRSSKRGRKPSFSRAEGIGTMHQVTYLGAIEIQKAS
jgi:hypothetical protein